MVADSRGIARHLRRLDEDEVEAERESRDGCSAGELVAIEQPEAGLAEAPPLPPADGLLRQSEVAPGAPANLDDDERRRRAGVDGHDVELPPADPDVSCQDRPARGHESGGDELFGGVAGLSPRGSAVRRRVSHAAIMAADD